MSAVEFIETADSSVLTIDPLELDRCVGVYDLCM